MNIPIFALSGWGINNTVFYPLKKYLKLTSITLPGITTLTPWPEKCSWSNLTLALNNLLTPTPVVLIGWSLGGLLAIQYAHKYPKKIAKIILLGCNPCFIKKPDWSWALDAEILQNFSINLQQNWLITIKKITLLSVKGSHKEKELFKILSTPPNSYDPIKLKSMLKLLTHDLREVLDRLKCPVIHILATQDNLIPFGLHNSLKKRYPQHLIITHPGSHVFFYEHPQQIATIIKRVQ